MMIKNLARQAAHVPIVKQKRPLLPLLQVQVLPLLMRKKQGTVQKIAMAKKRMLKNHVAQNQQILKRKLPLPIKNN
ncbi:MAG: hypothetical protein A2437_04735 [Bacteroidetes bacterium RIFOXYC2_FULL_40_12]|nr:MAG: hypothetical protein A2437_04735 [Bacteroidetes bacterium RIFOXYC2_FULL_40_12]